MADDYIDAKMAERLRLFVKRIERLRQSRAAIDADLDLAYDEVQALGLDRDALDDVIRLKALGQRGRIKRNVTVEYYRLLSGVE